MIALLLAVAISAQGDLVTGVIQNLKDPLKSPAKAATEGYAKWSGRRGTKQRDRSDQQRRRAEDKRSEKQSGILALPEVKPPPRDRILDLWTEVVDEIGEPVKRVPFQYQVYGRKSANTFEVVQSGTVVSDNEGVLRLPSVTYRQGYVRFSITDSQVVSFGDLDAVLRDLPNKAPTTDRTKIQLLKLSVDKEVVPVRIVNAPPGLFRWNGSSWVPVTPNLQEQFTLRREDLDDKADDALIVLQSRTDLVEKVTTIPVPAVTLPEACYKGIDVDVSKAKWVLSSLPGLRPTFAFENGNDRTASWRNIRSVADLLSFERLAVPLDFRGEGSLKSKLQPLGATAEAEDSNLGIQVRFRTISFRKSATTRQTSATVVEQITVVKGTSRPVEVLGLRVGEGIETVRERLGEAEREGEREWAYLDEGLRFRFDKQNRIEAIELRRPMAYLADAVIPSVAMPVLRVTLNPTRGTDQFIQSLRLNFMEMMTSAVGDLLQTGSFYYLQEPEPKNKDASPPQPDPLKPTTLRFPPSENVIEGEATGPVEPSLSLKVRPNIYAERLGTPSVTLGFELEIVDYQRTGGTIIKYLSGVEYRGSNEPALVTRDLQTRGAEALAFYLGRELQVGRVRRLDPKGQYLDIVVPTRKGLQRRDTFVIKNLEQRALPDDVVAVVDDFLEGNTVRCYLARVKRTGRMFLSEKGYPDVNRLSDKESASLCNRILSPDTGLVYAEYYDVFAEVRR